jgi:hypothetical protein
MGLALGLSFSKDSGDLAGIVISRVHVTVASYAYPAKSIIPEVLKIGHQEEKRGLLQARGTSSRIERCPIVPAIPASYA